jgi:hypothetical protein
MGRCSVEEFVYMTEGGYNKDEILKGERIILQASRDPEVCNLA